ncbi:MAG: metallophosphoesterase, partial [Bacteriovoracaceae bacterium]|nr:metallophosphoesterase [Bacteriovoracaceae bacterium]
LSGSCVALILIWALGTIIYLVYQQLRLRFGHRLINLLRNFTVLQAFLRSSPFGVGWRRIFKVLYVTFFAVIFPLLAWWGGMQRPRFVKVFVDLRQTGMADDVSAGHLGDQGRDLPHDFKMVFLSDLHLGTWQGDRAFLAQVVEQVNQENPDLVLLGGDLVDHAQDNFLPLLQPLQNLKAPGGVYFALRNHEGLSPTPHLLDELGQLGVHPLINQSVIIAGRFNLAGVGDVDCGHWGSKYLPRRPPEIDEHLPVVLLAHRPNLMRDPSLAHVDLALMGHTHGGQIEPFSILPRLTNLYFKGLYKRPKVGRAKAPSDPARAFYYVSQGTGTSGPPMRFLTFSEITVVHLQF